ncbi:gem-associated protein 2 isoform X3 [Petaurus breviceps papuanus]|uniref:gem-associated protein 2 isoform X3 n=1 Tax=Petaurus breviceps papuanus TaxID=3040969 RepID=UPI0036D8C38F
MGSLLRQYPRDQGAMESAVEELMPRLLPVEPCDLAEDFDPSVPPRTPQEYLKRVQLEAAQCPDVVVAHIDPKKLKRKQTVNVSLSGCQPAPEGYSPTLKWQQQQVVQFSVIRQSVNKHRNHWKSQHLDNNVTMPKSEDEEGWKKFCLGERLYAEMSVATATGENPGIDYVQIGFPPLLSIVSRMNQATITSVLEYLINWFGEKDFTPELVPIAFQNGWANSLEQKCQIWGPQHFTRTRLRCNWEILNKIKCR